MTEMVAWGMPVSLPNSFWLYPCNSRMMRTDSPTDTSMRFLAERKVLISYSPIVVRCNVNHLEQGLFGDHSINHPVLRPQARRPIPLPFSTEGFIMESFDQFQPS